jgi:hypothetical protein
MVRYFGDKDPTTRVMLERILAQEEGELGLSSTHLEK